MSVTDPILFQCAKCGKKLRVAADAAGKRVRCPKCSEQAVVPFPLDGDDEVAEPRPSAPHLTPKTSSPRLQTAPRTRTVPVWAVALGLVVVMTVISLDHSG